MSEVITTSTTDITPPTLGHPIYKNLLSTINKNAY